MDALGRLAGCDARRWHQPQVGRVMDVLDRLAGTAAALCLGRVAGCDARWWHQPQGGA